MLSLRYENLLVFRFLFYLIFFYVQENQQLQNKLLEFQTQMSMMRAEVANLKSEYDEQSSRLHNERGTVLSCVQEQENLTRQLQMLHEANKKLHDTNDDLRSALDVRFFLFFSKLYCFFWLCHKNVHFLETFPIDFTLTYVDSSQEQLSVW